MENVIATRRGPVLIDLEMLLQPVAKVAASAGPALPSGEPVAPGGTAATSPVADGESCLTTGFVTMVESNGGEVFDVGGLRGTGAGTAALAGRIWRDLDSDAIHFTDDATFTTRVRNAVRLDGAIQAPDAFAADLLEGFDATYRLLLAHREALLARGRPARRLRRHAGPGAAAADHAVRLAHLSPQPAAAIRRTAAAGARRSTR